MTAATSRPRRFGIHALAAAATLAAAGAVGSSAAAAAPIPAGLNYSQWAIGVPPQSTVIGDCRVSVGPVRDPWASFPNYRKIAGVAVACSTRKPVIEAYVYLQKWEGGRWVQKGNRGYGVLVDTYGSGGYRKGSQGLCGGAGGYWRTLAQVRMGASGWWNVTSAYARDPAGC